MTYIAGIHLSSTQSVESIVAASTITTVWLSVKEMRKRMQKAESEGGKITAGPKTFSERIITPIHANTVAAVPLLYLAGVFSNRMVQPEWYRRAALDVPLQLPLTSDEIDVIRMAAAAGVLGSVWVLKAILGTLGKQFHFIGTREKAELVSTGPYGVVRHPMYTLILGQLALMSVAHWSYIPLVGFGICLGAFAYKVPIEERLIEQDLRMGPAYVEYKKKVPYRLIPYIW